MKLILWVFLILALSGCGTISKMWAGLVGTDETCVDGVVYLQFPSGVSVKYKPGSGLQIQECK